MSKKRGNIRLESSVVDNVLRYRAVYTGPQGKRTLKRASFPLDDREAGKRKAAEWVASIHPWIRASEEVNA